MKLINTVSFIPDSMGRKKKNQEIPSESRKTLTITGSIYDSLVEWKGGERRGISFGEAISCLVEFAKANGYESALAKPGKK
jgi:predicted CopG family antitoxin